MLKKAFGIVLLASLVFLGQKQDEAFFCDTEINLEQILYESALDSIPLPPDSLLKKKIILPITAHIIRKKNGLGGIRETTILNEVERLNEAFEGVGIFFEVCSFNYVNNNRFYSMTKYDEARLITYNIEKTINLYFVNSIDSPEEGNICGYTYYPTKKLDHVFLANSCVPGGTTLIHELGHFFGLYHTHELKFGAELVSGANCKKAGDLICDTAADPGLRSSLVSESCEFTGFVTDVFQTAYEPPVHNYMSYSRNSCRNNFTTYQLLKMRLNYHYFKSHFKTLNTDFEVSDSVIVEGDSLTLEASGGIEYWWSTGDTTATIKTAPDSSTVYSVNIVTGNNCNVFKKYVVEVIRDDFIDVPEFVCAGQSGTIVLNQTKPHLVYLISDSDNNIIYSAYGNEDTLQATTPPLLENTFYNVTLANPESGRYWNLPNAISIPVVPFLSEANTTPLLPNDTICQGSISAIKIPQSSVGIRYQLVAGENRLGAPIQGTGDTLVLLTAPVRETVDYHLRLFNACEDVTINDLITFVPAQPPNINSLAITTSSQEVNKGDSVVVTIANSSPTRGYQLMLNNILIDGPTSGTGNSLTFTTPPINQSSDFCLVVYNNSGCRTSIEYPINIKVKDPKKALSYSLTAGNLLSYRLPESQKVKLELFYMDGRSAFALVNNVQEAGSYRYTLNSEELPLNPGLFLVNLKIAGETVLQRIIQLD